MGEMKDGRNVMQKVWDAGSEGKLVMEEMIRGTM